MKAQQGQINDIRKHFPMAKNIEIIAEAGLDRGNTFYGAFLAKVDGQHYKFEDGELIKKI
jgi:hypothetical protein